MLLWLTVYFSQTKYLRSGKKKKSIAGKGCRTIYKNALNSFYILISSLAVEAGGTSLSNCSKQNYQNKANKKLQWRLNPAEKKKKKNLLPALY